MLFKKYQPPPKIKSQQNPKTKARNRSALFHTPQSLLVQFEIAPPPPIKKRAKKHPEVVTVCQNTGLALVT